MPGAGEGGVDIVKRPQFVYVCFRAFVRAGFSRVEVPLMNIYTIIAARFFVCKESLASCRSTNLLLHPPSLHIFQDRERGARA